MKKSLLYIIIAATVLVFFAGYLIYRMENFSLFDVEIKKVTEIKGPNKSYTINLYYIPGNATAQNIIQVKQVLNNGESVLHNYERYNFVNSYEIVNDTTLSLILSDTTFPERKADTVFLKLP